VIGPVIDDVTTTRPWPLRSRAGRHALTENIVPLTLVPKIVSMSSSVMSASLVSGKIPALAHSTSMPPKRSTVAAAMRSQSSARATSAATKVAPRSAAAASPRSWSRPTTTTLAPAFANTPAMPLPMPLVPPVTMTVRSVRGVNN
jgi:hypothetical protein